MQKFPPLPKDTDRDTMDTHKRSDEMTYPSEVDSVPPSNDEGPMLI